MRELCDAIIKNVTSLAPHISTPTATVTSSGKFVPGTPVQLPGAVASARTNATPPSIASDCNSGSNRVPETPVQPLALIQVHSPDERVTGAAAAAFRLRIKSANYSAATRSVLVTISGGDLVSRMLSTIRRKRGVVARLLDTKSDQYLDPSQTVAFYKLNSTSCIEYEW